MYVRITRKTGPRIDLDAKIVIRDYIARINIVGDLVIESFSVDREEKTEIKIHFFNYREALEFYEKLKEIIDILIDMYLYKLEKFDFEELEPINHFLRVNM